MMRTIKCGKQFFFQKIIEYSNGLLTGKIFEMNTNDMKMTCINM